MTSPIMPGSIGHAFETRVEDEKPSKIDINYIIMDYLINEGYPSAAAKFAKEANIQPSVDSDAIQQRVDIRNAIHAGDVQLAIERINELNPQILDTNPELHFSLLRLQLIELIRATVTAPGIPSTAAFTPALEFATAQLAPRAPTSPAFLQDLERTMALLIFPPEKLTPQLKALLDPSLRQAVATSVNEAILASQGERREARIRNLVRLRTWAERKARGSKLDIPDRIDLSETGLDNGQLGDPMGVFSGIVGNADFLDTFDHPSSATEGIIVSIYNLGAFSGCILSFFVGDWLGRRKTMWFAMIWIIVGAVLQTTAYSVPHILVARYITGIGTGLETSTVPMYQSELCEASKRGRLVSSEPLFVGVGIVIAYFFDYGMSFVPGPIAWRLPIAMQIVFAIGVVFMVFGVPESPRYLYKAGRNDEALEVLCEVYDGTPETPKIAREQLDVLEALEIEQIHGEYKWSQLLKRDKVQTGQRVLLAYGMQFMNQMGGINLVVYFVPTALQRNVGLDRNLSLIIGGCVQCMFFVGSLVPTFFLDRLGRRQPMMWGSLALAISMLLISVLLSFKNNPRYSLSLQTATSSASVAFFFTYMLFFGATANCIPWVYVPEILPLHVRAKGTAVGISSNWLWNFVVVMITPSAINNLSWKAYLIFTCLNLSFIPLVYFVYPETSNLTLEEIDDLFTEASTDHLDRGLFSRIARPTDPVLLSFDYLKNKEAGNLETGIGARSSSVADEKIGAEHNEKDHTELKESENGGSSH
ncbi:sugar transporter-like protein 24 [Elsinoe australis]|uniref:Sugar transporter-like protein 24 n=1 Tax=Elsinoe australis TaxID=40998 RepID=A0A4V6DV24_9PEZI|nr:sugar transporter-like protein 24 [Elsinoe australis]